MRIIANSKGGCVQVLEEFLGNEYYLKGNFYTYDRLLKISEET